MPSASADDRADVEAEAVQLLRQLTDDGTASFRDGQWEAIESLVIDRRRALVVQRTGWGKSAVYFVATRLLRDRDAGATVLISPLLALMRNQITAAERVGIRAATINSTNTDAWREVEDEVHAGHIDVLLISPERLNNDQFRRNVLPHLARSVGLFVIDEAHCISDWGHDFRPDYRRIRRILDLLPSTVPVLGTTATANRRVVDDVVEQLGGDLLVSRGPLERESLALHVVDLPEQAVRLAWLADRIPRFVGSGIVYCLTVADARRVASWLASQGIDAVAYTGEDDGDDRLEVERRLLANEVKVVVATSALGMGFDKPDLTFVVHYQAPGSAVAYYQQVGRAGRAVASAHAYLLRGREDADIQDYFIETAFPPKEQAEAIVTLLDSTGRPMKVGELEAAVNVRHSRIVDMLKVLDVDGAVEWADGGWQRTLLPWTYPAERIERVTEQRRAEQRAMRDYAETDSCRMAFLRTLLDDDEAEPCGRCDRCTGRPVDPTVAPALVAAASEHLRSAHLAIAPRRQWIVGAKRSKISVDEQAAEGRALSLYGDGGWGSVVKQARFHGGAVPDEVVDAAALLVRAWQPQPPPTWLTFVPSTTAPAMLEGFATGLGVALGLPVHAAIERVRAGQPQRVMANSAQQLGNVDGAFAVSSPVPPGPVLLLDDIVDSGWTLTVCAAELRRAGADAVHPLVLAKAMSS